MSERNQPIISGIEGVVTIHSDVDATTSAILLNNWTANVAPTVTDDSNAGYAIGSEWTDLTADKSYKLVDATVGAAVWKEITAGAGGGGDVATDPIWDVEGDLVVATGNDAATRIPIGSAGTFLRSDATTADWSTASFPNTAATGDIIHATSANNYDNLTPGTIGDVLTSNGPGVIPSYQTPLSGVFTPTINSTNMVEVSQESDFGTAVGGVITLAANTAYFVRGNVNCTNRLDISNSNIAVVGWDRDVDELTYTGAAGAGDFITVTDVNFQLANLKLSSTNSTGGDVVLRAVNYNQPDYNAGRDKVLTIINCQFRNCFDVWYIEGFDLADIQNTLAWYVEATTIGCQFKNVSKLQLSSCEYVRWFDETLIGTADFNPALSYIAGDKVLEGGTFYESIAGSVAGPFNPAEWAAVGYATTPMMELLDNGGGSGFGAVNISGCVIHPQQTQNGIDISNSATIGFGTIASNTGIDIGLTTGAVTNFDYDIQNTTIVQANQKIQNGNAKGTLSIIGNVESLNTGSINPQVLAVANVNGGAGFTNAPTFPVAQKVITSVANCSFQYNSKIDANFMVIVSGTVEMSGDGFIACRLRNNGTPITHAIGLPEIRQGRAQSFSFSVIGTATFGSTFDVEFESLNTSGASNPNDIIVREFVLNGYQF